eukprot:scpid52399/ scgid13518/ Homeobox protein Hmx
MATMMTTNKFSIHSILGDSVNPGLTHVNGCNPVVPQTALTSAVAQEAALRAAFCNGYTTNMMPCSTAANNTTPAAAPIPAPHLPQAQQAAAAPPPTNGMNLALAQGPNQFTPAVTGATILRPPGNSPITWQPLAFYQDTRWTLPQQTTSSTEGIMHPTTPAAMQPSYQTTAAASCNVGCYGYDNTSAAGMGMGLNPAAAAQRPHVYGLGQLKLKKKKTRTVFTRSQIDQLELTFNQKRYLSSNDRLQLALSLKMTETQVKVWFQNRRNKWKREIATTSGQRPGSAESQSADSCMEKSSTTSQSGANDMTEDTEEWEECDGPLSSGEQFEDGGFPATGNGGNGVAVAAPASSTNQLNQQQTLSQPQQQQQQHLTSWRTS